MHNDIYQVVMFVPSSAGNGGRGRIAAGSAVAGNAVPRKLIAPRVPGGARRRGVARKDTDAECLCVYDVCAIISEERGSGERGGG